MDKNIKDNKDNKNNKKIKLISYKGFQTSIHYSVVDHVYYGKIENITDLITFESCTLKGILPAFKETVNNYIAYCDYFFLGK